MITIQPTKENGNSDRHTGNDSAMLRIAMGFHNSNELLKSLRIFLYGLRAGYCLIIFHIYEPEFLE